MPQPSPADIASVSDDPEIQQHYAAQAGIAAALNLALRKLWTLLDLQSAETLQATLPNYIEAVQAIVQQHGAAAAYVAAEHYMALRQQAGITEPFRPPLADPPPNEQIQATIRWATSDLWKSLAPSPLVDQPPTLDEVESAVIDKIDAATSKLVSDTGRNEMLEAIVADRRARGYARITREGACWFCMMLAGRGAVYDKDSFDKSNVRFDGAGESKAHDECHCTLAAIFADHFEPSAAVRAAKHLYDEVTKNKRGMRAKQKAFRRAYEGRADGPERTPKNLPTKSRTTKSGLRSPSFDPARDVDASRTTAELQATLDALEKSALKFDSPGAKARRDELRRKIVARG